LHCKSLANRNPLFGLRGIISYSETSKDENKDETFCPKSAGLSVVNSQSKQWLEN